MDNTKTKTFIAFINKSGHDKWWIDGNCPYESDRPRILPYQTKEDKETAIKYGRSIGLWEESEDVYGVVLTVTGEPFEIINRKDADILVKEYKDAEELRKKELGITDSGPGTSKKKRKKKTDEVKEKPVESVEPKKEINAAPQKIVKSVPIEKKVGRPAKIKFEE